MKPTSLASLLAALAAVPACGGEDETFAVAGDEVRAIAADVRTQQGVVRGVQAGQTWAWRGVPYARPPLDTLRFRPPQDAEARGSIFDASEFGAQCAQREDDGDFIGSEDCLTLNIWAPANFRSTSLPVLFFIHGGGHQQGSSSQLIGGGGGATPIYDGQYFVERSPVVMVTINYRLGPFGFLAHPALSAEGPEKSGNYGMLDQLAALRWVRDNISGFGGDSRRVTIFGESAGAVSVCRLVASPAAQGLIAGAIMESGACTATPLATAEANGLDVAAEVGCGGSTRDPARCLRRVSTPALLATVFPLDLGSGFRNVYDGVIGGRALPAAPLEMIADCRHNKVPMILGTNTEELGRSAPQIRNEAEYVAAVRQYAGTLGNPAIAPRLLAIYPAPDYPSPRAAYVAMTSDIKFNCPTRKALLALDPVQSAPVHQYVFSHVADLARPELRQLGATHGSELPFVFGTLPNQGPGDREVITTFNTTWTRFATSADPWRSFTETRETYFQIEAPAAIGHHHRSAQCEQLAELSPQN